MTQFNSEREPALRAWLARATCQLSSDSAAQVRTEIAEHYDSARESAITDGATPDEADRYLSLRLETRSCESSLSPSPANICRSQNAPPSPTGKRAPSVPAPG